MELVEKQIAALSGHNIIWWNMCSLITINGRSVYTQKFDSCDQNLGYRKWLIYH